VSKSLSKIPSMTPFFLGNFRRFSRNRNNQWFARMALVALGKKKHCVCTGTFGTEIKPTPESSPQPRARIALMGGWGRPDGVLIGVES
jgi:hypothetical protein